MRLQTLWYYLKETFYSLSRNLWMTIASVLTITLAMLILGLFASLVTNLEYIADEVESQIEITCYVDDLVTQDQLRPLSQRLMNVQGVQSVELVTRDDALERLKNRLGDHAGLLGGYEQGNNPLQDYFIVKAQRMELVPEIAAHIGSNFVEIVEINSGGGFVAQLSSFTALIRVFGVVVMVGLIAAALFIIVNTIRLTVFARRNEIEIMRHVGATNWFIRVPFFLEGLILGLTGSGIAYALTFYGYEAAFDYVASTVPMLAMAPAYPFLNLLFIWMMTGGALFGVIGSMITLGRYLRA